MGFGPIQFGGLASGLDTDSIISALLAVEALPIQSLETQVGTAKDKIKLFGSLDTLLGALKDKANALGTESKFLSHTVTASEEGVAGFTLSGSPAAGSHTLVVNALAAAESFTFDGLADKDTTTMSGSLAFTYAGTNAYSIDLTGLTLEQAAAAINTQAGADVTASVVNTGPASSPSYQLVIAGNDTGAANQITGLTGPPELVNPTQLVDASNAEIELDNLTIVRETNSFSDVLAGVQIDALAADPSKTISFTVDVDGEGIKAKIVELVDAFNAVVDFINDQQVYTPGTVNTTEAGETGGPLFGDPTLSNIKRAITDALFDIPLATIQADTTGFSTLGLVGIDIDAKGRLSIDDAAMDAKMAADLDAFMNLFTDVDGFDNQGANPWDAGYYVDSGTTDTGLADDLARKIDELLESKQTQAGDSLAGLIQGRIDGLNANVSLWEDKIEDLEAHLEDFEFSLVMKFTALEELMSSLNAQGSFLTAQFSKPAA